MTVMNNPFKNEKTKEISLTISAQTYVRLVIMIIGTIVLLAVLRKASHALLLVFIAFFLALALNAPMYWISRRLPGKWRNNRSLGTTISFLIVIILLAIFIASMVPPLVKQTESFINVAPHLVSQFRDQNGEVGHFIRRYHLENQVNNFSSQLSSRLKNVGGTAFSTAHKIGSSIFSLFAILVLTFMMLAEGSRW
jgi:predicted PurR-regulated permease PerM